jgi:hypothetical protein
MKDKLKDYIKRNFKYPFRGDFEVIDYKLETINDTKLDFTEVYYVSVKDESKTNINFLIKKRDFNLLHFS